VQNIFIEHKNVWNAETRLSRIFFDGRGMSGKIMVVGGRR